MRKIVIGIQARSTSTRFPRKCDALIGGKRSLEHVIDAAKAAERYSRKFERTNEFSAEAWLIIPEGDPLGDTFSGSCRILQGPEHDVLSRYIMLLDKTGADFVVRITGDCPLIPSYIISRHMKLAGDLSLDYLSNIYEDCRTAIDGEDCEVISARALRWLDKNALNPFDREHVTTALRRERPQGFELGATLGYFDLSHVKLSIDTQEDHVHVLAQHESVQKKLVNAYRTFGRHRVFRI